MRFQVLKVASMKISVRVPSDFEKDALKIEAVNTSETSANLYETTQHELS
jgi:hypothetical protein